MYRFSAFYIQKQIAVATQMYHEVGMYRSSLKLWIHEMDGSLNYD